MGSLVDKLSIKKLRLWHMDEILAGTEDSDPKFSELQAKREQVEEQGRGLAEEINAFLAAALEGKVKIRDEKLKLYDNKNVRPTDGIKQLGEAIGELALRNIKCWHLEDEVRRTDLPDAEIVRVKRQIDTTNQERNDLMDKIDQILWEEVRQRKEGPASF